MKTKKFAERFKVIIEKTMENKKFSSYRSISEKAGVHNSNITNFISGRTKTPDNNVLRKLSLVLGYPEDFLSQLQLYCDGITKVDPEITHQANILCGKHLPMADLSESLINLIYKTKDKEKLKALLKEELKADNELLNGLDKFISLIGNPENCSKNHEIFNEYFIAILRKYYVFSYMTNDPITETSISYEIMKLKATKINKDTQNKTEPFRYPLDHYEQRPVFKATGGKLKQYITDGFTGNSERQEWGYFKAMPNAFFVEVEGNSMSGAGIKDKDYCLVNPHAQVNDGDIVLAISANNEATIKKFLKSQSGIMLIPYNPDFEPIFIPAPETENWNFYKIIESRHKF